MALQLESGDIHLWYVARDSSPGAELRREYEALLQSDERRRYDAFKVERARQEYLVTRALVRCVLSRYSPVAPGDWRFRLTALGRPEIDPPRSLRFNLSNCEGLVACAVVDGRQIGVDVEPHSRGPAILELASSVFADGELEDLERLEVERRVDRALSLWTLKESYLKARGLGLSLPLRSFGFALEAGQIALSPPPPYDEGCWDFTSGDITAHRLALAIERRPGQSTALRVFEMTPLAGEPREVPGAGLGFR